MIYKLLMIILRSSSIFSLYGFRNFRNFSYRKYFNASQIYVSDNVVIATAHYNRKAFFKAEGQVNIGSGAYIDYSGGVRIGNKVAISEGAKIFTHNHSIHDGARDWETNPIKFSELVIDDFAWIGASSIILPSVTKIGEGSIIAAGAVLTKNSEPYGVYAGNPAKLITIRRINE
ncbi:acyltransferase [Chryseobacterium daecheongense]|uniref:acyltransferase n=1 Tax=Chryseobacterium daecheongense TaxID=192389 RepID=UPI001FD70264|nr:acyltransferase [Chryseobacterium daecheongense]UOU96707.1 acyltransferase [Chryseobacterium daecheongense]